MSYFDKHYVTEFFKEEKIVKLKDLKPFDIILEEDIGDFDIRANLVFLDYTIDKKTNYNLLTLTVIMPSGEINNLISFETTDEPTFKVVGKAKAKVAIKEQ